MIESRKRGFANITELGLKEYNKNPNLIENDLKKYSSFVDFITKKPEKKSDDSKKKPVVLDDFSPDKIMEKTYKKINKDLSDSILESINNNELFFFKKLVVDLLLKMGYGEFREDAGFRTPSTNDSGFEGIINQDKLGLNRIGIQAKKYDNSQKIDIPLIQSFVGAILSKGLVRGVFITTSSFTNNALEFVKNQSNLTITLIDGDELASLMIEYDLGVSTTKIYTIKQIDSNYFNL